MTAVDTEFGYSSAQVCRIVGCSYRQVEYWDKTGVLCPSITEASGSGSAPRRYSHADLLVLLAVTDVVANRAAHHRGIDKVSPMDRMRALVEFLRPRIGGDLTNAMVVIRGERHSFLTDAADLPALVQKSNQTVTVVNLGDLEARIAQAILDRFPVVARSSSTPSGKSAQGASAERPATSSSTPARMTTEPDVPPST